MVKYSILTTYQATTTLGATATNIFTQSRMLLIPGTGNGEPGTGVWEQVYSGKSLESSKWQSRQKKRLEEEQFGLR